MPLTSSAVGSQNKVHVIPHEKSAFYSFVISNHLLLLFLSNFVHKHKAIPGGVHSSVCNLRFVLKHILSVGKPQQRIRQEMMKSAKQDNRVPSCFHL